MMRLELARKMFGEVLLALRSIGGTEDLVDVGRGTVTSVRWTIEILFEGTPIEDGDVLVATAGKP